MLEHRSSVHYLRPLAGFLILNLQSHRDLYTLLQNKYLLYGTLQKNVHFKGHRTQGGNESITKRLAQTM